MIFDALREVDIFEDLSDERVEALSQQASKIEVAAGDYLVRHGETPSAFHLLVEGRIEWSVDLNGERVVLGTREAPTYFGATNLALDQPNEVNGRIVTPSRLVRIDRAPFTALLGDEPGVLNRTLRLIAPVQRGVEAILREREKLASLGTLTAGLAHELNNPAAAARRSAQELARSLEVLADTVNAFVSSGVERGEAEQLVGLQRRALAGAQEPSPLGALELADREDALAAALGVLGLEGWRLARPLAEAGVDQAWLERAAELAGPALPAALEWVVASLTARGLAAELETATDQISTLVRTMKDYTYMDRGDLQEVDIHHGLESTLIILKHKLKRGDVELIRDYDSTLPPIMASGSGLNQVWTNLIDNALGALDGRGTLTLRTGTLHDAALVEIVDDGPGIPTEVQSRIFEPFFTTKGVGEGTGLGLDVSKRIVAAHGGDITFTSRPGETRFLVRLPLPEPGPA